MGYSIKNKKSGYELDKEAFEDWWVRNMDKDETALKKKPFAEAVFMAGVMWGKVMPKQKLSDTPY